MAPRAVQFGAGSIGRGFIGALLAQSGYHVTFADIDQPIIDALNQEKGYHIHILLPDGAKFTTFSGTDISGCNSSSNKIIDEIVRASVITTAVGPDTLKYIAPVLARGFSEKRAQREQVRDASKIPGEEVDQVGGCVNVIACENRLGASTFLKQYVMENLENEYDRRYVEQYVGFPNCSVDRIVPPPDQDRQASLPTLDVDAESFHEWVVERPALKGSPPFLLPIKGMSLTDQPEAYVERKLFTLNTGHAMAAYLGYLKGHKTISESIHDDGIARSVQHAMQESGAALVRRHNFDPDEHATYIDKTIDRFRNPHLKDECVRVGREPLRKLGRNDRLIGPAQLCKDYDFPNRNLCRGIAAVFRYDNENDPQSVELGQRIHRDGVQKVAIELTGWSEDDAEIGYIMRNYKDLENLQKST